MFSFIGDFDPHLALRTTVRIYIMTRGKILIENKMPLNIEKSIIF